MLEELVEAGGHELHADPDVGGGDEAAEADDDVAAVDRLEHHVQVHDDPLRLVAVARPTHLKDLTMKERNMNKIQGDHSVCDKLPLDIKIQVPF